MRIDRRGELHEVVRGERGPGPHVQDGIRGIEMEIDHRRAGGIWFDIWRYLLQAPLAVALVAAAVVLVRRDQAMPLARDLAALRKALTLSAGGPGT